MPDTLRFVQRSRKELRALDNPKWAIDAISEAAALTMMLAPDFMRKVINLHMELCGRMAASLLVESDDPLLSVPGYVVHDGAEHPGVVLNTRTGAIVVWDQGVFRPTWFGLAIPDTSVLKVNTPAAPPPYNHTLCVVTSEKKLTIHFVCVWQSEEGPGTTGFLDKIVASLKGQGRRR